MKRKFMIAIIPLLFTTTLTACNSKSTCDSQEVETITRKAIVVLKNGDREYLTIGETNQLTAYSSGDSADKFNFKSLNEELASVDENGLVTALKEGDVKIEVSLKSDATVKKTVSFTIVKSLMQSLPELQEAIDDVKSYDYKNGMNLSFDMALSLGDITASISLGGTDLGTDINLLDTYETPISVPVEFDVQNYKDEDGVTQSFVHYSLNASELISTIKNALPSAAQDTISKVDFSSIYQSLANKICPDFEDYLKSEDFTDFYSFECFSYGKSDTYLMLTRNFGTDDNPDIRAFAFNKGNLLDLMTPYADQIVGLVLKSLAGDSTSLGDSSKINEFLNKLIPGVSVDMDELMTKDGIAFLQTVLAEFLETTTEGTTTTIKLNKSAMDKIQNVYSEYVTESQKSVSLSNSVSDISINYSLPTKLDSIKLVIDNSLTDDDHKVKNIKLEIDGIREVKSGDTVTETPYSFMSLTMNTPKDMEEGEMDNLKTKLNNYEEASKGIYDLSSTTSSTIEVKDIIEKANEIYNAEIEYGADKTNSNLQKVKNQLMTYYYSDAYKSEERQDLLYPMVNRLTSLDFTYQDEYVESYLSLNVDDTDSNVYTVNHFKAGSDETSFTKTYTSSNEDIISVDEDGNLTGHQAYYNGEVTNNKKQYDNTSKITLKTSDTTTSEEKTFSQTFTYTGSNVGFRDTKTTLNSSYTSSTVSIDYDTREIEVTGKDLDVSKVLSLPSGASVTYTSKNITVGYFQTLTNKSTLKVFLQNYDKLCGVVATVNYTENGESKTEDFVFYVTFKK